MRSILAVLLLVSLAGCTDETEIVPESVSPATGAIRGLVLDDRFRPLELTDAPRTEFQHRGFVLVQQTGDELRSDKDGAFEIPGLAPGTYTLRPNVDGHEGVPAEVRVAAGEYTDVSIIMRRIANPEDNVVLVFDNTVLVQCTTQTGSIYGALGSSCFLDASGEGGGSSLNFAFIAEQDVQAMVLEFDFPTVSDWSISVHPSQSGGVNAIKYAMIDIYDSEYGREELVPGESYPTWTYPSAPLDHADMVVWLRPAHTGSQETFGPTGQGMGVGITLQSKARVVSSIFLTEPEDLANYALLG